MFLRMQIMNDNNTALCNKIYRLLLFDKSLLEALENDAVLADEERFKTAMDAIKADYIRKNQLPEKNQDVFYDALHEASKSLALQICKPEY